LIRIVSDGVVAHRMYTFQHHDLSVDLPQISSLGAFIHARRLSRVCLSVS